MQVTLLAYRVGSTKKGPNDLFVIRLHNCAEGIIRGYHSYPVWEGGETSRSRRNLTLASSCYTESNKTCIRVRHSVFISRGSHKLPELHQLVGWGKGLGFLSKSSWWMLTALWVPEVKATFYEDPRFITNSCDNWESAMCVPKPMCVSFASNCLCRYYMLIICITIM